MSDIEYRSEFIKLIEDRLFYIDGVNAYKIDEPPGEDWSISHANHRSFQQLEKSLSNYVKRIIFDPNLPQKELQYFTRVIAEQLDDFSNTTINNTKFFLQNDIDIFYEGFDPKGITGTCEETEITKLPKNTLRIIENYSQTKYNACKELINGINKKIDMKPDISFKKTRLNLSVDEISLLFSLLVKEGIIDIPPKKKAEFYRFIASVFSSKERDDISPNSVKNNFHTINDSTIKNIRILLINLKSHLDDLGK